MILWAVLVEISVVDTHSPFIVLFLYKNGIRYPFWMDYFFNESSREKFSDLPFNASRLSWANLRVRPGATGLGMLHSLRD
jgi:hypothetical protein